MKTSDIQSVSAFRANLTSDLERIRETGRPLFLTQNGTTAAVVLSPEDYDRIASELEVARNVEAIRRGLDDVKAGRAVPADEAEKWIRQKTGLKPRNGL